MFSAAVGVRQLTQERSSNNYWLHSVFIQNVPERTALSHRLSVYEAEQLSLGGCLAQVAPWPEGLSL